MKKLIILILTIVAIVGCDKTEQLTVSDIVGTYHTENVMDNGIPSSTITVTANNSYEIVVQYGSMRFSSFLYETLPTTLTFRYQDDNQLWSVTFTAEGGYFQAQLPDRYIEFTFHDRVILH